MPPQLRGGHEVSIDRYILDHREPLPKEAANAVYDILCQVCGAFETLRYEFVRDHTEAMISEYDFVQGILHRDFNQQGEMMYVEGVPEPKAAEANKRLADVVEVFR